MFIQVLSTEFLKLRRAKITWLSWLALSVMPLVGGVFMWIVKEPNRAERLGLLGSKAEWVGVTADWPSYFGLLLQITGIGGMILVSVIAAYVFGREYAERTAKNALALPIGRHWIAMAKFAVILVWFSALTLAMIVEGLAVGALLGLPSFTVRLAVSSVGDILLAALVAWLLAPVVAWIATLGRGYLAPLGFSLFTLIMGMTVGATGWGKWFPWSIVPLFAGVAGPRAEALAPESVGVVVLLCLVGAVGTILHLRLADSAQ